MKNRVYIDVMLNGAFIRQMRYDGNYHLEEIDGEIKECISEKDMRDFVESRCSWLAGKPFNVEFTTQRISP